MFVHYGLYSSFGGRYNGKVAILGEWIQRNIEIPISEYESFARENFCPSPDFAKNLVKYAKDAGMRYIVLTSKHHDGFCLFKSDADSYNSYDFFGRDLCREVVDACREAGLGIGFYYSHALDWHEKNAGGNHTVSHPEVNAMHRNYWDYPDDNIDFEEYFRRKCLPQVRELLTNYGDLKCIWFDYPHDITYEQSLELRTLVKSLQPDCLINSRIGYGFCDYYSLGDNCLPTAPARVPTECLITLNETWGYKIDDTNYKSPSAVIEILCRALAADSTLLVNVGPMSDGSLTEETLNILSGLSEWTERNSEAIYGKIKATPFKCVFPWGYASLGESSLYLYLNDETKALSLSGIKCTPKSVSLIGGEKIKYDFADERLSLEIPENRPMRSVVRVEFDGAPELSREIEIDSTRSSILAASAMLSSKSCPEKCEPLLHQYDVELGDFGKRGTSLSRVDTVHHWESEDDVLAWDVNFIECGEYEAEIVSAEPSFETYCSRPDEDTSYTLSVGDVENRELRGIKHSYNKGTLPSSLRHVRDGGVFRIDRAGKYRVSLSKDTDALGIGLLMIKFNKRSQK